MPKAPPIVLLVDNGSLEPAATVALREVAERLSRRAGFAIRPVSLLHSSGVDPSLLGGRPAEILEPTMRRLAEGGQTDIVVLPLFLGPSAALTDYLPERVRHLQKSFPSWRVRVAPSLVETGNLSDTRLAAILAERVREEAAQAGFSRPTVAVVDHGTPQREVNAVRELVAKQVRAQLGDFARTVAACSMERRPEPQYDFNEPLLEKLLEAKEFSSGEVVVARLFLLPGRHAGPGGDIEQICRTAQARHKDLNITCTEPLASHPQIVEILADRLKVILEAGNP